jgi:hypothetical protein
LQVLASRGADDVVCEAGPGERWDGDGDRDLEAVIVVGIGGAGACAKEGFLAAVKDFQVTVLAEFEG